MMFVPIVFVFVVVCGSVIKAEEVYEPDHIIANLAHKTNSCVIVSVIGTELLMANYLAGKTSTPYHVYGKANWFMAQDVCAKSGMKLVRINDQNKNEGVTKFVETLRDIPGPFWTLASKLYDGNTWAFSLKDPVKYFNWANCEPTEAADNKNCIEIHKDGEWYNNDCSLVQFILCEKV